MEPASWIGNEGVVMFAVWVLYKGRWHHQGREFESLSHAWLYARRLRERYPHWAKYAMIATHIYPNE